MNRSIKTYSLLIAVGTLIGATGMYFAQSIPFFNSTDNSSQDSGEISLVNSGYTFINPLLFCGDDSLSKLTQKTANDIQEQVSTYISDAKSNGDITDASVYVRDLKIGPWALINPDLQTAPSSLLKVPLAISIYKHAEDNPGFFAKKIVYGGGADVDSGQYFQPAEKAVKGLTYSVDELIKYMLVDSDNTSMYLLGDQIDDKELIDSYQKFGIEPPTETNQTGYTINAHTFASFFRILYNASYLTKDDSERLLSLLSKSSFTQGIVSGVPAGVVVSHKFGEGTNPDGKHRLNDCGIVYKPQQPYLICIMTQGKSFDGLSKTISGISKIVWNIFDFAQ